jgi:hypothetical protein
MSILSGNGGLSAADIAAVMGNGNGGNYGNWGADGAWWLVIIMLFALTGGNWGNGGFGGNGSGTMFVQNDVQRGFDQSAVMSGINGLTTAVSNGFANAEISRCNTQANLTNLLNDIAMQQQNCCCENRAAVADLKYTVATENCADRAALSDGIRDVIANQQANTQNLINSTNQGLQNIMDKICQLELDAKNDKIADLQRQVSDAQRRQELAAVEASIIQNNGVQTSVLENYLNPPAIPAYVVPNPNCCNNQYYNGCGRRTTA